MPRGIIRKDETIAGAFARIVKTRRDKTHRWVTLAFWVCSTGPLATAFLCLSAGEIVDFMLLT